MSAGEEPAGPQWIQVEVITVCNLKCTYCDLTNGSYRAAQFPLELVDPCFEGLGMLQATLLHGFGEPMLYKPMREMIARIRRHQPGISIQTVTNGTIDTARAREAIADVDVLHVSIDSLDPSYWSKVRVGGDLNRIRRTIESYRAVHPKLHMVVNCVVSQANCDELGDLLALCAREGYQGLSLIPLFDYDQGFAIRSNVCNDYRAMTLLGERLEDEGAALGVTVYHPYDPKLPSDRCLWPSRGAYVLVDGRVTPCCVMSTGKEYSFGSLQDSPLRDLWASVAARSFRRGYRRHATCQGCLDRRFSRSWNLRRPLPLICPP